MFDFVQKSFWSLALTALLSFIACLLCAIVLVAIVSSIRPRRKTGFDAICVVGFSIFGSAFAWTLRLYGQVRTLSRIVAHEICSRLESYIDKAPIRSSIDASQLQASAAQLSQALEGARAQFLELCLAQVNRVPPIARGFIRPLISLVERSTAPLSSMPDRLFSNGVDIELTVARSIMTEIQPVFFTALAVLGVLAALFLFVILIHKPAVAKGRAARPETIGATDAPDRF